MALKLVEGWELYSTSAPFPSAMFLSKWGSYQRGYAIDLKSGRYFGNAMSLGWGSGVADFVQTQTFSAHNTWIFGMNIRRGTSGMSGEFARLYHNSTVQLTFAVSGTNLSIIRGLDGIGTTIATVSGIFSSSDNTTWTNIQVKCTIDPSGGTIAVLKDGRQVLSSSSLNTDVAGTGLVNGLRLTGNLNGDQQSCWVYDDLWICDGSGSYNNDVIPSSMIVEGVRPRSDGYQNDGIISTFFNQPNSLTLSSLGRRYNRNTVSTVSGGAPSYSSTVIGSDGVEFGYQRVQIPFGALVQNWYYFGLELPVNVVPGATITSATLTFHVIASVGSSATPFFQVGYRLGTNPTLPTANGDAAGLWDEIQAGLGSVTTFAYNGAPVTIDITNIVQEAINVSGWTSGNVVLIFAPINGISSARSITMITDGNLGMMDIQIQSNTNPDNWESVASPLPIDVVKLSTVGDIESYPLQPLSNILGNIHGVSIQSGVGKNGTNPVEMATFVRKNSTNDEGDSQVVNRTFPPVFLGQIQEKDPQGTDWNIGSLNSCEAGVIYKS